MGSWLTAGAAWRFNKIKLRTIAKCYLDSSKIAVPQLTLPRMNLKSLVGKASR